MAAEYIENIKFAFRLIIAREGNPWDDLINLVENDSVIPTEAKIAMGAIIRTRYLGSERRFATLDTAVENLLRDISSESIWEDFGFNPELVPTLGPYKEYVFGQFLNYVLTKAGSVCSEFGILASDTSNFTPPQPVWGYGYGYDSDGDYGYGYGYRMNDDPAEPDYFHIFGDI